MKKIILALALVFGIFTGGFISSQPTLVHTATTFFKERPTELSIPSIGLSAPIEQVGQDATGAMDVPKNIWDVAWYKLGPQPGEKGSAVIAGHLDSKTGPAVFANLGNIKTGDEVQISNADGKSQTFVVERTAAFKEADFPIREVYGAGDRPRLNLITCQGTFDRTKKEYSDRLVIFTVLKN